VAVVAALLWVAAPARATTFDVHTLAMAPDGKRVYASQSGQNYSVLSRDGTTGLLTPIGATAFQKYSSGDASAGASSPGRTAPRCTAS